MKNVAFAALMAFAPLATHAQSPNCAPRGVVIERLADRYGEARQSIGLDGQGRAVEVFANIETGSWTITVTLPNGLSCLSASGHAFEALNEAPKGTTF